MDIEPFKHGFLLTPPQSLILKRTWQKKYYALYQASNLGIQRLEVFDSEDNFRQFSNCKLIPLNDCIKVVQAPQKNQQNVFEVICRNHVHQFSAETTQELAEWIGAFQTVAFGLQHRDSLTQSSMTISADAFPEIVDDKEEENLIYSSVNGPEEYIVYVIDTDASRRCGLKGVYQLLVAPVHLAIVENGKSAKVAKTLFQWPYRHIRKFGHTKEQFSFEAGRKCASGEGNFSFETKEGNAIFQSIRVYVKAYKKESVTPETTGPVKLASAPSSVRCISSPLPPSPPEPSKSVRSSLRLEEIPSSHRKMSIPKIANTDESYYENVHSRSRPPITKPPRKSKGALSTGSIANLAENLERSLILSPRQMQEVPPNASNRVSDPKPNTEVVYSELEMRQDAWKTFAMKTDNIHIESLPPTTDEPLYNAVEKPVLPPPRNSILLKHTSLLEGNRSRDFLRQISVTSSRKWSDDSEFYDHLSQFGHQQPKYSESQDDSDHIYRKLSYPASSEAEESPFCSPLSSPKRMESQDCNGKEIASDTYEKAFESSSPTRPTDEPVAIERFVHKDEVYSLVVKANKKNFAVIEHQADL